MRTLNQLLLDDLVTKDLPASGLLRDGRFNPHDVVKWIAEREGYRDMLPASLHTFLRLTAGQLGEDAAPQQATTAQRTGAPGRPSSMHLVLAERTARVNRGETLRSKKDEAEALHLWFKRTHPAEPAPTALTIRNRLSRKD